MKIKIRQSLMMFFTVTSAFMFLSLKNETVNAVSKGLELCGQVLIPSLIPFMLLSSFSVGSGIFLSENRVVKIIMKYVFKLPAEVFPAVLFGFVGGYPVGARVIASLYEKSYINSRHAKQLLSFCVNSGPAFCISAVGASILGSGQVGYILFFSTAVSSLAVGIVYSNFAGKRDFSDAVASEVSKCKSYSESFNTAVYDTVNSILNVCAWVLVFSSFSAIIKPFILNEKYLLLFESIFEVTGGIRSAFKLGNVPFVAFSLSFGGISVLFQNASQIKKCGIKIRDYLCFRIAGGILSYIISAVILNIFNISISVGSVFRPKLHFAPASCALLIMCAILLMDTANADKKLFADR